MTHKITLLGFSLIISTLGFGYLALWNWKVAIAVFLVVWGDNVSNKANKY